MKRIDCLDDMKAYNPKIGDIVFYTATDLERPVVGMIIDIYEEDIEGFGPEMLCRIEWYEMSEEYGYNSYGYSLGQTSLYRHNYLDYRKYNGL